MNNFPKMFALMMVAALLVAFGCKKKEEPAPAAEKAEKPEVAKVDKHKELPNLPFAKDKNIATADEVMKVLEGAAFKGENRPKAAQVKWEELAKILPKEVAGWKIKGEVSGATTKMMGFMVSQAECKLGKDKSTAHVTVIDTNMNPMLAMPFTMSRKVEVDSDKEVRAPVDFGSVPATKAFMKKHNKSEVLAMVDNRILVSIRVDETKSFDSAVELAQNIQWDQLAALVKAPKADAPAFPAPSAPAK